MSEFRMRIVLLMMIAFSMAGMAQSNLGDTANYPYWIEMMEDPSANFYETQKAFEKYWEGRERQKGDGWKIYKRWEYNTELRIDEFGNKPKPNHSYREYQKYFGQKMVKSDEDHWKELGPVKMPSNGTGQPNGLGRINGMGFHPSNANTYYAGASSGGLWKTTDNGSSWDVLTDTLPTLGVSSIVVDYSDPDIVYIGTGDRDHSAADGKGVWKSTDAGKTWKVSNTGMGDRKVGMMVQNALDSMTIIAATNGGIYKTTNGGASWSRKSSNTRNYKDIKYKPGDTSTVYATEGGYFYRSTNGGETWSLITSGIPKATRMVIGVTPDNGNVVYVVATNNRTFKALYKSTNSGASFVTRSTSPNIMDYSNNGSGTSGQAWYDLCVAVDPDDEDIVYVGGVNIFRSTNSGSTWSCVAHWTGSGADDIHADQHYLEFSPVNGNLFSGNDGGVYYTTNGTSWVDRSSGMGIAQVYKIGQSTKTRDLVINGYQDNGTAIYDGNWITEIGGDGMECIVDPGNDNYMYGSLYYGDIRRSSNKGSWFSKITSSVTETGEWVTPFLLQEGDPTVMFAGYKRIWKLSNARTSTSWTVISGYMGGNNNRGVRVLENSPADNDILYVSVEDGSFQRSDNITAGTPTFTNLTNNLPVTTWPLDIEADPFDPDEVYIVLASKVYKSTNKGGSWTNITGTLPNVPIKCIVIDSSSSGDIYIGTEIGVFFKGSWMSDWEPYTTGLPAAIDVRELEIYYNKDRSKSRIRAATYGRGLWSSQLYIRPEADFSSDVDTVCADRPVQFRDESTGFYTDMFWSFPGGNPSSSTANAPSVSYPTPGQYTVSLTISNDIEGDSVTKMNYISVDSAFEVNVTPQQATINAGDSILLVASGSQNYIWEPSTGLTVISSDSVLVSPPQDITYRVIGGGLYCPDVKDTAFAQITVNTIGSVQFAEGKSEIIVYPNPADDNIYIRTNANSMKGMNIEVIGITGRSFYKKVTDVESNVPVVISVSELNNGVYFLILKGEEYQSTHRVIIDHSF